MAFDEDMSSAVQAALESTARDAAETGRWITRWVRAGWLSDQANADHMVALADRATATSTSPVIYVEDVAQAVEALGLRETSPGDGVLLIASTGSELEGTETDNGIKFVSRTQGVLDAFAGSGREPDKAEDALRHLLAATRS